MITELKFWFHSVYCVPPQISCLWETANVRLLDVPRVICCFSDEAGVESIGLEVHFLVCTSCEPSVVFVSRSVWIYAVQILIKKKNKKTN